jgi:hypothetical protein
VTNLPQDPKVPVNPPASGIESSKKGAKSRIITTIKAAVPATATLASLASIAALTVSILAFSSQNAANREQARVNAAAAAQEQEQQAVKVSWVEAGLPDPNGNVTIVNSSPNPIKYVTLRVFAVATTMTRAQSGTISVFLGPVFGCKQGQLDIQAAVSRLMRARLHATKHEFFFLIFYVSSIWFVDENGRAWTEDAVGPPQSASVIPIIDYGQPQYGVGIKPPLYKPAPGCS